MKKVKFDHSCKTISAALDMSDDEYKTIIDRICKVITNMCDGSCPGKSKKIEYLYNNFSQLELCIAIPFLLEKFAPAAELFNTITEAVTEAVKEAIPEAQGKTSTKH